MLTQPAVALGAFLQATSVSDNEPGVAGLTANKVAAGAWSCTLDNGLPPHKISVLVTSVGGARSTVDVTFGGTASDGLVHVFTVTILDNAGAALDCGASVAVFVLPDLY